jgi:3-methyladenine DNA glycosylase/8-oxoguanine DNA glycosylase
VLQHGSHDPCHRVFGDVVWRTSRQPSGPVTYRVWQQAPNHVVAQAWGSGASELIAAIPMLLGDRDNPEDFDPRLPILREAHRSLPGLRIVATGRVLESLIPAVLEQKVVGLDAAAAWRRLVVRFGEVAPGPAPEGMRVPPSAAGWLAVPSWEWHRAGVEQRRAETARRCASYAEKFERAAAEQSDDPQQVYRLLTAVPGVGGWTAAQVGHRALGDADALPVGDYHLAAVTGRALIGRALAEDEVESFYEPWRPHRYRVVRLIELGSVPRAPRRGPRVSRQDYRRI